MNLKAILATLLAFCLMLPLCACGGEATEPTQQPSSSDATTTTTTTAPEASATVPTPGEGQVLYTIKVVDAAGAPVKDVYVQLCLETCVFTPTDANGVAYFTLPEADYKVTIIGDPAATEYHFASGTYELTITYTAASDADAPAVNDAELSW